MAHHIQNIGSPEPDETCTGCYPLILCSLCLILCASVYLASTRGLTETLEAESAEIAREFVEGASFLINHLNGQEDLDKPPLFYWTIALSSTITPNWELAARLPSLFSTCLILLLFVRIGELLDSRTLAAISSLVFLSNIKVFWMSQIARIDMSFSATCFFAIYALFQFAKEQEKTAGGAVAQTIKVPWKFFLAAAVSVMLKGPVGAILIFCPALLFLALEGRWHLIKEVFFGRGMILFLTLTVPWFVAASIETNGRFFHRFFLEENLSRFTDLIPGGTYKEFNYSPLYTYPVYFLTGFFPWSIIAPLWLLEAFQKRSSLDALSKLLLLYVCFIFVFFSIAIAKRSDYILPAYPAAALLTARYLMGKKGKKIMRAVSVLTFGLLISIGALALLGASCVKYLGPEAVASLFKGAGRPEIVMLSINLLGKNLFPCLILFSVSLSGLVSLLKKKDQDTLLKMFAIYGLHMGLVFLLAGFVFLPEVYKQKEAKTFCKNLDSIVDGEPLFYFDFWDEECTFYLHRRIMRISLEDIEKRVKEGKIFYLIVEKRGLEQLNRHGIRFKFVFRKNSPALRPLFLVSNSLPAP